MPITIRPATTDDVAALVEFNQGIARETEDRELDTDTLTRGVRRFIEGDGHGFYTVAEDDGLIVGSLMITYEWSDWRDGVIWWIQSVYVRASHRRQGVYRSLYAHIRELGAQDPDCRTFRLYVEKDNRVAQETYRNLGMEETYYRIYEADSP